MKILLLPFFTVITFSNLFADFAWVENVTKSLRQEIPLKSGVLGIPRTESTLISALEMTGVSCNKLQLPEMPSFFASSVASYNALSFYKFCEKSNVSLIVDLRASDERSLWKDEADWSIFDEDYEDPIKIVRTTQFRDQQVLLEKMQISEIDFQCDRLHFLTWKDHSSISVLQLAFLIQKVLEFNPEERMRTAPLLVHCRGGIGRTGTFLTCLHLYLMKNQLKSLSDKELEEKMDTLIVEERRQVSPFFVENEDQYALIKQYAHFLRGN